MRNLLAALTLSLFAITAPGVCADYDPLAINPEESPPPVDLAFRDDSRQREVPLRVFLPREKTPAAVVLFSHGLGGTREVSGYLGRHWAARGYVAIFLQHHGSDDAIWKGAEPGQRLAGMRAGASVKSFADRVRDVSVTLDQLAKWNAESGHPLAGRLDLEHVGMSGHSFGAITTQAVSGQSVAIGNQAVHEPRIKAAVAMSPSVPRMGDPRAAFASVKIPWLLMTGTKDTVPIFETDAASRLAVFRALPPGDKYELVLRGAEHSAFVDRALPGDHEPRNPNHHRVILALSTAFWDAYLRGDAAARQWLQGDGPRKLLEEDDAWQRK